MSTDTQYRKLTGGAGFVVRHKLWLGSDHLLAVRTALFWEEYRRFYFRDIQALVLTEVENSGVYYGYLIAGIAAVLALGLAFNGHPVWAVLAGLIALPVFAITYALPDCRVFVKTQVSWEHLRSLKRLQKAREAVADLRREIEMVQGTYNASEVAGPVVASTRPPAMLRHCDPRLHLALFIAMIASSAIVPIRLRWTSDLVDVVSATVVVSVIILGLAAAIRQHGSDIAKAVRWVVLIAVVLWGGELLTAYGVTVAAGARAIIRPTRVEPWRTWFQRIEITGSGADVLLGAAGLALLAQSRRSAGLESNDA
ncbi:MAG TPA: hypothetical protein VKU01_20890 [Bryobacteraceae bacterium]|nr:hypothetical protein [Bryobacteraceae bacterium]